MKILRKQFARFVLLVGDVGILALSLYLALSVRYLSLPTAERLITHFQAFIWLFVVWVGVFFVAGLYDRQTLLFPKTLPRRIFQAQVINSLLGVVFFYTIPYFAIAPKTNLFIFVAISFALILLWRNIGIRTVTSWLRPDQKPQMILVAGGEAARQVDKKIHNNPRQGIGLSGQIDPGNHAPQSLYKTVVSAVKNGTSLVVVDTGHPTAEDVLPKLYNLLYNNVQLYEFDAVYEELFDRVPLPHIRHRWFVEHINLSPHMAYDFFKRAMDVIISATLLIVFLPFFPFVALAIWLEDGGPIFFTQERIGEEGRRIQITKLRSMTSGKSEEITTVGWFLRRTRIDEIPQLWNVLRGDLSLIGPRPESPDLAKEYQAAIPYYNARHLIKPGISGWAQLKHDDPPKYDIEIDKTKDKLSYDLYYVKHRSLLLDIKIALQTLQVILSQSGK